jgi:hypothetical protein
MDKAHYLHCLKTGVFDTNIFYEYYQECNKREEYNFSLVEFHNIFNQYISIFGVNNAIATVKQHYNIKFEIVEVIDKEGKIIDRY